MHDALASAIRKLARRLGTKVVEANPSLVQYADGSNLYEYVTSDPVRHTDPSGCAEYCGDVTCHCAANNPGRDVTVPVYGCSVAAKIVLGIWYGSGGCFVPPPASAVYCTMPCEDIDLDYFMPHECCHACEWRKGAADWLWSWIPGDLMSPAYCDISWVPYTFTRKGP